MGEAGLEVTGRRSRLQTACQCAQRAAEVLVQPVCPWPHLLKEHLSAGPLRGAVVGDEAGGVERGEVQPGGY